MAEWNFAIENEPMYLSSSRDKSTKKLTLKIGFDIINPIILVVKKASLLYSQPN